MRADAQRNYDRLLAEASKVFASDGVDASLEEIARSAGVGIGTLYRHFPTRDALLEALMSEHFERARARAEELADNPDPVGALESWLADFMVGASTYRGVLASVASALSDPHSQLYASCHAMREAAGALVTRAQKSRKLRKDVSVTDVLLMAAAVGWAGEQARSRAADDFPARMLGVLIDGMRT